MFTWLLTGKMPALQDSRNSANPSFLIGGSRVGCGLYHLRQSHSRLICF